GHRSHVRVSGNNNEGNVIEGVSQLGGETPFPLIAVVHWEGSVFFPVCGPVFWRRVLGNKECDEWVDHTGEALFLCGVVILAHVYRRAASAREYFGLLEPNAVWGISVAVAQEAWPRTFGKADARTIGPRYRKREDSTRLEYGD